MILNSESLSSDTHYFWDSWYLYDADREEFHILMLYALRQDYEERKHHEHSQLAYAYSRDLINWEGYKKIKLPLNDSSSIWTGSVIRWREKYILAYTLRQTINDYFADQTICFATSTNFTKWTKCEEELKITDVDPENKYFLRFPEPKERTIHAWRDPYLFVYKNQLFMLVAAKRHNLALNCRACVALFRAKQSEGFNFKWKLICPSLIYGYEELEVPQIYVDQENQEAWIVASTWDDRDYEISWLRGNRPTVKSSPPAYRRHGYLLSFRVWSIEKLLNQEFYDDTASVLIEPEAMLYAGRIVPEQNGKILGFDPRTGSPKVLHRKLPAKFDYLLPSAHKY